MQSVSIPRTTSLLNRLPSNKFLFAVIFRNKSYYTKLLFNCVSLILFGRIAFIRCHLDTFLAD
ncbi:hypothetical protein CPB86DRAFT_284739 [Serendipita vermifera]|nr:hypothetical protein CPB86DRAFT_284739 [Serendipita vermifera]